MTLAGCLSPLNSPASTEEWGQIRVGGPGAGRAETPPPPPMCQRRHFDLVGELVGPRNTGPSHTFCVSYV